MHLVSHYIIKSDMTNYYTTLYNGWNVVTGDFRTILTTPPISDATRFQCHSAVGAMIISMLEIPNWFVIMLAILAASIIIGIMMFLDKFEMMEFSTSIFVAPMIAILLAGFIFVVGIIILSAVC
jgi:hypothetical protein